MGCCGPADSRGRGFAAASRLGASSSHQASDAVVLLFSWRASEKEQWKSIEQRVPIVWTKCHLGGGRPWFRCRGCRRWSVLLKARREAVPPRPRLHVSPVLRPGLCEPVGEPVRSEYPASPEYPGAAWRRAEHPRPLPGQAAQDASADLWSAIQQSRSRAGPLDGHGARLHAPALPRCLARPIKSRGAAHQTVPLVRVLVKLRQLDQPQHRIRHVPVADARRLPNRITDTAMMQIALAEGPEGPRPRCRLSHAPIVGLMTTPSTGYRPSSYARRTIARTSRRVRAYFSARSSTAAPPACSAMISALRFSSSGVRPR
jgi:hypothetical protein